MIELDVIDPKEADREDDGLRFWRSTAQLERKSAFEEVHKEEFRPGASEPPSGASRRQFLQLMGAAMAMAGLTACRRPVEKILPYARKPEEIIPGIPQFYATGMPFRGVLQPLLIQSHEGRPTKVEGNPEHPSSQGGTSPYNQASVLNLYDPDRSHTVRREGAEASWNDFMQFCRQLAEGAEQKQIAVLIEETSSPTVAAMRRRIQDRFPNLRWLTYAAEGSDNVPLGMQQAFGRPLRPQYAFDEAAVIVSLDADFLGGAHRDFLHNARTFAAGRRLGSPEDDMSRLYAVESAYSTTGGMADNRLRMKAGRIPAFAAALAAELGVGRAPSVSWSEKEQRYVSEIARDLREAGPRGVVLAGETQDPAVHALAMAINSRLGSVGTTVSLLDTGEEARQPQDEQLRALVDDMNAGTVDALFLVGVNPVYDAPAELDFENALRRVNNTVHVGLLVDETARACRWHVPRAHYLEAWGDGRAYDGTLSVVQPLIAPLYADAHSDVEVLNAIATGLDTAGYDLVREQWRGRIQDGFEQGWRRALHDGYLPNSRYPTASVGQPTVPQLGTPPDEGLEVVFRLDPTLLDGRFSNNAWMQELPDPVTKIVWDNVAMMSQATADELGVGVEYSEGNFYVDRITLSLGEQSVELPVWIQPGYPDGSIGVTLGYGRSLFTTRPERETPFWDSDDYSDIYADGPLAGGVDTGTGEPANTVGSNVSPLKPVGGRVATGATVSKADSGYLIATTQEEGSLLGRPIVRWATLEEYREDPDFVEEEGAAVPGEAYESFEQFPMLWEEQHPAEQPATTDNPYHDNQWGMVIDLNTCIGCNACIVACTSENNVQVVGKREVSEGRHMYWLRTDRYYVSTEDNAEEPEMMMQPMMCQHCENAPCESVCPVAATVHSPDGTNQMVYNRCIGTRYCSNNCPYKVRRFNFYNWTKTLPIEVQMAQNPSVSVRFRGVMEKCSWCIHRVRDQQRRADNENRDLRPDEIQTACQQACPTNAIVFGDLNNADSTVVQQKKNSRDYELLAELNVKPRLSYLGRVRNPNPRLEEAAA